jgi:ribosome hibernation promoting factor
VKVDVRIQGIDLEDAVRSYARRRLQFALGRFGSSVGRVGVRVHDVNGSRGGVDQCCHISAEVLPSGKVVVEQIDAVLFAAIDRAADRAAQAFGREIRRRRDARTGRQSVRVPGSHTDAEGVPEVRVG